MWGRVARARCRPGPLHPHIVFLPGGQSWVSITKAPKKRLGRFHTRGCHPHLQHPHPLGVTPLPRESPHSAWGVRVSTHVCVRQAFSIGLSSLCPCRCGSCLGWGRTSAFCDRAFPVLSGCWWPVSVACHGRPASGAHRPLYDTLRAWTDAVCGAPRQGPRVAGAVPVAEQWDTWPEGWALAPEGCAGQAPGLASATGGKVILKIKSSETCC